MIIYGLLAEVSIIRLFAAGQLPGLMIAALCSLYIGAMSVATVQAPIHEDAPKEKRHVLADLWPILTLIVVVVGAIYSGWATPSEAAAVGVIAALALMWVGMGAARRTASWPPDFPMVRRGNADAHQQPRTLAWRQSAARIASTWS